jgi:transcriptional regulator with XRE-family HTH domain
MNHDRKNLGARLREAREYVGLSQDEVARALGIARPAVSLIESGQRRVEALELKRLADLYGRSVAEFTGDSDRDAELPEVVRHLARAAAKLTKADQSELIRFAEFLKSRSQAKPEA